MEHFTENYFENIKYMDKALRVEENFDIIKRDLTIGGDSLTLYYIDGFIKDGVMQRIMQGFLTLKALPRGRRAAKQFSEAHVSYVEVDVTASREQVMLMVLSGAAAIFGSTFGGDVVLVDARTYPARTTAEPDNDRVMQGARDGFVETLIFNTALLRRRIRDPRLTMQYINMGGSSATDVVLCYMDGVADPAYVRRLKKELAAIRPKSLTLGMQSLVECLIPRRWFNPFPKVRTTERPDAAAAHLNEGRILIFCDTSPQVMILPTSLLDFLQETDDFYMPPLTGTYLRAMRLVIFLLSYFLLPTWYLLMMQGDALPDPLAFLIPKDPGGLPILMQLYLVEFAIDGLKLASMNTPNLLANSLSVIGGLILGDFAVGVGWVCADVIFYMAVVAIAGFSGQNIELSYAIKFLRMLTLALTALFGIWGYLAGGAIALILTFTNRTLGGKRGYLYPLIPFHGRALCRLLFRLPKWDVERDGYSEKN